MVAQSGQAGKTINPSYLEEVKGIVSDCLDQLNGNQPENPDWTEELLTQFHRLNLHTTRILVAHGVTLRSTYCHDCGVAYGDLHTFGCDMEECPFCLQQLIGCDCWHERLGLDPDLDLTTAQEDAFLGLMEGKGRILYGCETPYI